MRKKRITAAITAGLVGISVAIWSPQVLAKETKVWKDTSSQRIPEGRWTDLQFDGKTVLRNPKGTRALYCTQLHLDISDTKPRYVKIRFARHLPGGKLDTTATNTWVIGKDGPRVFHGSMCWTIKTKYPVSVQAKVVGKASSWVSTTRQFKIWSPSTDIPEDVLVIE